MEKIDSKSHRIPYGNREREFLYNFCKLYNWTIQEETTVDSFAKYEAIVYSHSKQATYVVEIKIRDKALKKYGGKKVLIEKDKAESLMYKCWSISATTALYISVYLDCVTIVQVPDDLLLNWVYSWQPVSKTNNKLIKKEVEFTPYFWKSSSNNPLLQIYNKPISFYNSI